jgi:hypothetical protein
VFVADRGARLPLVALLVLAVHVPAAWLGAALGGVDGLALALAVSTGAGLVALLSLLDAVRGTLLGLAVAAAVIAGLTAAAFVPADLVLAAVPAAACGLALYAALLAVTRPRGLRAGWRYLRDLR